MRERIIAKEGSNRPNQKEIYTQQKSHTKNVGLNEVFIRQVERYTKRSKKKRPPSSKLTQWNFPLVDHLLMLCKEQLRFSRKATKI